MANEDSARVEEDTARHSRENEWSISHDVKDTLAERSRPYPKNRERLAAIVRKFGAI